MVSVDKPANESIKKDDKNRPEGVGKEEPPLSTRKFLCK